MNQRLVIDLAILPEDGGQFTGELAPEIFDLPEGGGRPLGPLRYDLHVQRFETELFLSGELSVLFEFTCVRGLHPFAQTIRLDHVPLSIEIAGEGSVDVSEALREEILLAFPADPKCENGDQPGHCSIDPRYLAVDKGAGDGVEDAPPPRRDGCWAALDAWSDPAPQDER